MMNCPNCKAANPDGARFCMNCGTALSSGANQAAPPASPESRLQQFIPKELLNRLESTRSSKTLEGERRIVTMLFCDVKDSTASASRLDPEEWAEIINHAFESMIRPVYHYEGTVARLMGDGLLAFFGAPIAHEDDPQRAVLAGLEMIEGIHGYRQEVAHRWGIDLDVRVGINTGLVVVGAIGSDLRLEYTAVGDAINLAARMEQTAQPGTVRIAEATNKLVAPLFETEFLGLIEVKGKPEPVQAYRVLGRKAEPGRLRGIAGLEAPLIGRDREFKALHDAIGELQQGEGQIVSVIGEAGLGKSRLVTELRSAAVADPNLDLRWAEGRSLSFETPSPYAPFIDLFEDLLGLQPQSLNERERYAQLKSSIAGLMPDRAGEAIPFIAALMGIRPDEEDNERVKYLEPPQLRSLIFSQVSQFFERLALAQPLVLVFDDVHWIDPTSLELLESLLPITGRAALMILAAFRPRKQELSWSFHETALRDYAYRYTPVSLSPLDEGESRELVGSLLHIEDLPEKVRRLILERSEGNPFFVEEMIRSLLDSGWVVREDNHWRATREIENITIPNTLVGVITARLDRLDETAKQAAQAASVVGREFAYDVLSSVFDLPDELEGSLGELQQRELIREKLRLPQRKYSFKHILTQEAAYGSILLSRRRELHHRTAETLEQFSPEAAAEIARHFLEARQPARALPYLVEAGDRAARAYSNAEALEFYSRALELKEAVEDLQVVRRAYEGLGGVLTFMNQLPQALENYQAMLHLAERQSDIPMQVSALNKLASVLALHMGQFQEADGYLARADRLGHEHDVNDGIVEMSIIRCQMCMAVADFERLVQHMGEVVEIGRSTNIKEHVVMGMEHVATGTMFMAHFDEAWQRAAAALEAAREIGDRAHEAWLLTTTIPFCLVCRGELDEAQRVSAEGVEIGKRIGSLEPQIYGNWLLCEIARWQGNYEQALKYGQRAVEAGLQAEEYMPFMTVQPLGSLGSAYLDISGHYSDQVARFHTHALKILENPAGASGGGTAWADLGFCALTIGDLEIAETLFQKGLNYPTMFKLLERPRHLAGMALVLLKRGDLDQAMKLIEEARDYAQGRGMRQLDPLIALASGQIRAARGETAEALVEFERAEMLALDLHMRPIVWQARAAAAQVLDAAGRTSEAQAERQAALEIVDEIAAMFQDEGLRESFLKNARGRIG